MRTTGIAGVLLGLAQTMIAGTAGAQVPSPVPGQTAQRPPQAQCPAVADVDFRALDRERRREAASEPAQQIATAPDSLAGVRFPDWWTERRPPADAPVVIRARMPPGGGYGTDLRAIVWREADGGWWFWRQTLGGPPSPPPPPPPPGAQPGSPEWEAWEKTQPRDDIPRQDRQNPPAGGRLGPGQSARLEAAWGDPCRGWDPDFWPFEVPLNRRIDGSRRRICAQDSSAIFGEIIETGQPPRRVGGSCGNATPTYRMIEAAVYAGPADPT